MLATMRPDPWDDATWVYEPKWDGFRMQLHVDGERIALYSRPGREVSAQFPERSAMRAAFAGHAVVVDGELVCLRHGRPNFEAIAWRGRLHHPAKVAAAAQTHPVTFVPFDLLACDGQDRTRDPLVVRRHRLETLLVPQPTVVPTLQIPERGRALFQLMADRGWEGIVAKRAQSPYRPGVRSHDWVKVKCWQTATCIILGYRRAPHFALVVGMRQPDGALPPVGVVKWGFRAIDRQAFWAVAPALHTDWDGQTQWLRPGLACAVRYLEWTSQRQLRTPTFLHFLPGPFPGAMW